MNIFLRVLLRNLSLGFGAVAAAAIWIIILFKIGNVLVWAGLPAGFVAALFLMSIFGSLAAVAFTLIEVKDRKLVSMNDIDRLFGIPEKENKPKPNYRF